MACYNNRFKGRANRKGKAQHLIDEFDAIAACFVSLNSGLSSSYVQVYTVTTIQNEIVTIDPANGLLQEVTITQDSRIELDQPDLLADPAETRRVSLLIHGAGYTITNGWGSKQQTWRSRQTDHLLTGGGATASAMIDFYWDGQAWIGVTFGSNSLQAGASADHFFPLTADLASTDAVETFGFTRAGYAMVEGYEGLWEWCPTNEPRFQGSRYVRNYAVPSSDLTVRPWDEDNGIATANVAAAGPDGETVTKLTFANNASIKSSILIEHGIMLNAEDEDKIKLRVRFQAKAVSTATSIRMGTTGTYSTSTQQVSSPVQTVSIGTTWAKYSVLIDCGNQWYKKYTNSGGKQLLNFYIKTRSGGVTTPIYVTNVQFEIVTHRDDQEAQEFQETTLDTEAVLVPTVVNASWVDATNLLTFTALGGTADFDPALTVGKMYAFSCVRQNSGIVPDIWLGDVKAWDTIHAYASTQYHHASYSGTFVYRGGQFKFHRSDSEVDTVFEIHIQEVLTDFAVYDTEIGNSVAGGVAHILTEATGAGISSDILDGVFEEVTGTNLVPRTSHRRFDSTNWTKVNLRNGSQGAAVMLSAVHGLEGYTGLGLGVLQDTNAVAAGYGEHAAITIAADSTTYTVSLFVLKEGYDADRYFYLSEHQGWFMELGVSLSGGTAIAEERVRLQIIQDPVYLAYYPQGAIDHKAASSGATAVMSSHVTEYQDWWRIEMVVANNGTNTALNVRIYPAVGSEDWQNDAATGLTAWAQSVSAVGYQVVDWLQVEAASRASSPILGDSGNARAAEVMTSVLADDDLYDEGGVEAGDVTSGGVTIDDQPDKNLSYVAGAVPATDVNSLHEWGEDDTTGTDYLCDELSVDLCDEYGGNKFLQEDDTDFQLSFDEIIAATPPTYIYQFQDADWSVTGAVEENGSGFDLNEIGTVLVGPAFRTTKTQSADNNGLSSSNFFRETGSELGDFVGGETALTVTVSFKYNVASGTFHKLFGWRNQNSTNALSLITAFPSGTNIWGVVTDSDGYSAGQQLVAVTNADTDVHIFTLRWDGPQFSFYKDGVKLTDPAATLQNDLYPSHTQLEACGGSHAGGGHGDHGTDLFMMHTSVLTDAEIIDIHDAYMAELL